VQTDEKTRYDINAENAHVYSKCISENIEKGRLEYVFNSLGDVDVPIDNIIFEFKKAIFTCGSNFKKVIKRKYKHGNKSVGFLWKVSNLKDHFDNTQRQRTRCE